MGYSSFTSFYWLRLSHIPSTRASRVPIIRCVCVCVCARVCGLVGGFVHACMRVCVCVHGYVSSHIKVFYCECVGRVGVCIHVCVCACLCVYVQVVRVTYCGRVVLLGSNTLDCLWSECDLEVEIDNQLPLHEATGFYCCGVNANY